MQASTTLCRCQMWISGEASLKRKPNISLKRGFYLFLVPFLLFLINLFYPDSYLNRLPLRVLVGVFCLPCCSSFFKQNPCVTYHSIEFCTRMNNLRMSLCMSVSLSVGCGKSPWTTLKRNISVNSE